MTSNTRVRFTGATNEQIKAFKALPKKSVDLTFPKLPPYKMDRDYMISKNFTRMPKLYPAFDVVRQDDPISCLGVLQSTLNAQDRKLRRQRKHLVDKRQDLNAQWSELAEKEKSFRDNFEEYETFVRENAEKRERAEKKIKEDVHMRDVIERDIYFMRQSIYDMEIAKLEMETAVRNYNIFEAFLEDVVKCTQEFNSIEEIINRYHALKYAKVYLAEAQEENLKTLETAKNKMVKMLEKKQFIIMGLNNQIANLQKRFEQAKMKSLDSEQLVVQIKNYAIQYLSQVSQVKLVIRNMCEHMETTKNLKLQVNKDNIEGQLIYIKKVLTELRKINHMIRKKLKIQIK